MKTTTRFIHHTMKPASALLVLFLWLSNISFGQTPFFRVIKTTDEIDQTSITCLYQDLNSYMWVGTTKGLYRFDGNNFKYIPVKNDLSTLQVSAIFMNSDKLLWVGTRQGEIYHLVKDSLRIFNPEEGNPKVAITGFISDKKGNIWYSTYGEGIYYYNGKHVYNINTDDGLTDNYCYTVISDQQDRQWVATDGGISIINIQSGTKNIIRITTNEGLPDNMVLSLTCDSSYIWAGMQDAGFCKIDVFTRKIQVPQGAQNWNAGPVTNIVSGSGWKWISSGNQGIYSLESGTGMIAENYQVADNINISRVNCMTADNQGNYWIAAGNRLLISTGQNILHFDELTEKTAQNIHSVTIDHENRIWFSNDEGLHYLSKDRKTIKSLKLPFKTKTQIISLFADDNGLLWAGTFGNGLYCINPKNNKSVQFGDADGLSNGNILSVTGKGNQLWLATLGGAIQCKISGDPFAARSNVSFLNYQDQNFPGNNYIYHVLIDSRDRVWFATDGKGISVLDKGRYTNFDKTKGLKSNIVYSIAEDGDGNIWFSTSDAGIYCFNGKTLQNYNTGDGLSDIHITGLIADKSHQLLIVHNNGIDVFDTRTKKKAYYGGNVGLNEINPDLNTCVLSSEGVFWFGTQNGLKSLQLPGDISKLQPDLKLDMISLFMGKDNYYGTREFSYKQNHISFHFNALWYSAPSQIKYQIRLKGYDLDWIDTRNNIVSYSNLPPGNYVFEVRYSLKGNFNNSEIKSYAFEISKPFWKTDLFIILAVMLSAIFVYLIIHLREKMMQRREAIAREKIVYQFQTLQSQVNPHFLFNSFSTLISIIDEDKDIAIDFVEKLSQFFRNILEYRDQELITLEEELKLINTYYYLQKKRYCENFQLETSVSEADLKTLVPPMVLQMLVENAIKHNIVSAENPLIAKIHTDTNHIFVTNNFQPKKVKGPSTGIGLQNIRNRYALLGFGEILVDSNADEFIIKLPLIHPNK